MIVFYLIGFLLISAGIVILLGITPEVVTDDVMKFISPKQTLRDKAEDTLIITAVFGNIQLRFQCRQNAEQP